MPLWACHLQVISVPTADYNRTRQKWPYVSSNSEDAGQFAHLPEAVGPWLLCIHVLIRKPGCTHAQFGQQVQGIRVIRRTALKNVLVLKMIVLLHVPNCTDIKEQDGDHRGL